MERKIESVISKFFEVPLDEPLVDAKHGVHTHFHLITTTISLNDGNCGTGYTYTGGTGGQAIKSLIDHDIRPFILGRNPDEIEEVNEALQWHLHYVGRGGIASFAISAIDVALWDLRGKQLELPLWKMAGGAHNKCKAYCGGIDLDFSTPKLLESIKGYLEKGVTGVKIKVGKTNLRDDLERIKHVRDLIGPQTELMVDANYSMTEEAAIKAGLEFKRYGILWFEEPIEPDLYSGYASIAAHTDIDLAMGENLHTQHEFDQAFRDANLSYIQPDASNCCGITGWLKIAKKAKKCGVKISSHGMHELHVSLVAAQNKMNWMEVHSFPIDKFTKRPLQLHKGYAIAPDMPGIGVEFDWKKLEILAQSPAK
ncbi:MAG: mandelate racemase/muconate lactonizing enzyme family protein [Pseudomonadota bacterium]|nr:mandelate racemase/muconate lactonizing enzyme family protein [Pseudomonadota bacterium]